MNILVMGASGSGTTTLGAAAARRLGCRHLDTDNYYWLPTTPPYRKPRDPLERLELLLRDLASAQGAVVSGSVTGWGRQAEEAFDLIVFLYVPTETRVRRLEARDAARFGRVDPAFLQWAREYDQGPSTGRSLAKHRAWLAARTCPVLRIEGEQTVEERMQMLLAALRAR